MLLELRGTPIHRSTLAATAYVYSIGRAARGSIWGVNFCRCNGLTDMQGLVLASMVSSNDGRKVGTTNCGRKTARNCRSLTKDRKSQCGPPLECSLIRVLPPARVKLNGVTATQPPP